MSDISLKEKISRFANENRENIIRDIGKLVAVESISSAATDGRPFGIKCGEVLDTALEIASGLGLETKSCVASSKVSWIRLVSFGAIWLLRQ